MIDANWMNIIDTAIKVGLGALISGVTAYFVNRRNHLHDVDKTKWEARKTILNDVIKSSQEYFSACSKFLSSIDGVSKDVAKHGKPFPDYAEFLHKADSELEAKRYSTELCYGYLVVLVGDNSKASSILWEYDSQISKLRDLVFRNGVNVSVPGINEIDKFRTRLSNLRYEFFACLNKMVKVDNT